MWLGHHFMHRRQGPPTQILQVDRYYNYLSISSHHFLNFQLFKLIALDDFFIWHGNARHLSGNQTVLSVHSVWHKCLDWTPHSSSYLHSNRWLPLSWTCLKRRLPQKDLSLSKLFLLSIRWMNNKSFLDSEITRGTGRLGGAALGGQEGLALSEHVRSWNNEQRNCP